jgi:hypothetical protein
MLDVDTFLTALYVIVDYLCHSQDSERRRPGPPASLCRSEVITSLSSPAGRDSPAKGTSTATPRPICEGHSLPFRTVPNSTASCASMPTL